MAPAIGFDSASPSRIHLVAIGVVSIAAVVSVVRTKATSRIHRWGRTNDRSTLRLAQRSGGASVAETSGSVTAGAFRGSVSGKAVH